MIHLILSFNFSKKKKRQRFSFDDFIIKCQNRLNKNFISFLYLPFSSRVAPTSTQQKKKKKKEFPRFVDQPLVSISLQRSQVRHRDALK